MSKGCGCEKCKAAPPVVDAMEEGLDRARLLGEIPFMVAIRAEDFAAVELWLGEALQTAQGVPVRACLGRELLVSWAEVACLEEYRQEVTEAIAEAARSQGVDVPPVHGLAPGSCFVFTLPGEELSRSD